VERGCIVFTIHETHEILKCQIDIEETSNEFTLLRVSRVVTFMHAILHILMPLGYKGTQSLPLTSSSLYEFLSLDLKLLYFRFLAIIGSLFHVMLEYRMHALHVHKAYINDLVDERDVTVKFIGQQCA